MPFSEIMFGIIALEITLAFSCESGTKGRNAAKKISLHDLLND
jgi:hypothetical protein